MATLCVDSSFQIAAEIAVSRLRCQSLSSQGHIMKKQRLCLWLERHLNLKLSRQQDIHIWSAVIDKLLSLKVTILWVYFSLACFLQI